jgi:hypothetical protein
MRKTFCASVLVLALCGSALAGDITNPPSPADCGMSCPPPAGETPYPTGSGPSSYGQTDNGLSEAALWVIDSVLGLF